MKIGDLVRLGDWRRGNLICRSNSGYGITNGGQFENAFAYRISVKGPDGRMRSDIETRVPLGFLGLAIGRSNLRDVESQWITVTLGDKIFYISDDELEVVG